jgi:hypothetical protein
VRGDKGMGDYLAATKPFYERTLGSKLKSWFS